MSAGAAASVAEGDFAALVDELAADTSRADELVGLLREDHPVYAQRGTAATVRMRGWILLALARTAVPEQALLFVLEELDTGIDPYLIAAAARALRAYPKREASLAPFVMRALANVRWRDEPVCLERYGEYAVSASDATSPITELLAALAWLGPHASGVLPELESFRDDAAGLSKDRVAEIDRTLRTLRDAPAPRDDSCCSVPRALSEPFVRLFGRRSSPPLDSIRLEDHEGRVADFADCFRGRPTIVAFFYTRCDNPLKCSLTIAKLAGVQRLLAAEGVAGRVRIAAITYDPEFDTPERLATYARDRGFELGRDARMLRAVGGNEALRRHFELGVNFVESIVNRHRIELYLLDSEGCIVGLFDRIRWTERQVIDRALELLHEREAEAVRQRAAADDTSGGGRAASPVVSTAAALALAFFPKCPFCWAAYLSVLGIAGLERLPYAPWLQPVLALVLLINLASVWSRARAAGRMPAFYAAAAGAVAIMAAALGNWEYAGPAGVMLTLAGSLWAALGKTSSRRAENAPPLRMISRADAPRS